MTRSTATLNDAIRALSSDTKRGFSFVRSEGGERTFSFAEIATEAGRRASALHDAGLRAGDRVVLIVPEPQDFVLSFLGAVAGGLVPVPMFPPFAARDLQIFEDGVEHVSRISGAKARISTASLDQKLAPLSAKDAAPVITTESLAAHGHVADLADVSPDSLAFLQFTSGSTSRPKGVMVSHGNLAANAKAFMHEGLRSDPAVDHGVSWLPLFHDMGLIGFVVGPLFADVPVTFIPTATFVRRPLVWLETITKKRGTITYAPNFAYELVAKRLKPTDTASLDLSSLRHAGCGAEPISASTLRTFAEKLAPAGFDPKVYLPSYGMAESTLAVTFGGFQRGVRVDAISAKELENGRAAQAKDSGEALASTSTDADRVLEPAVSTAPDRVLEIVCCGRPFAGHEITIRGDDLAVRPDGVVGHIMVRGPSVCAGYFGDAERTGDTFSQTGAGGAADGGWLRTGDLGYMKAGELYVCGREKDLIIVRGRNYYPSDIEWAVSEVDGVRKGAVVAFSVRGEGALGAGEAVGPGAASTPFAPTTAGERLIVAAEAATSDPAALRAEIVRVLLQRFSLSAEAVELLSPSGLPRTSSGKLQRAKTKDLYRAGVLPRLRAERSDRQDGAKHNDLTPETP